MNTLKKILSPLASLRLTVVLLATCLILVFAGTLAQRSEGIWQVQHEYFHSWFHWIPVQNLLPFISKKIPGVFPWPGGFTLIVLLLVNLLAAHTLRFKLSWKRAGILLIHFGLILLLTGEVVTAGFAVESQMVIDEGQTTRWSQDIREYELAVVEKMPGQQDDKVVVVPEARLAKQKHIADAQLPFVVDVVRYYPNSDLLGPMQPGTGDTLATAGQMQRVKVVGRPKVTGTESEDVDRASAFLKFTHDGQDLGTYLVSLYLDQPQMVKVGDKTYEVTLRFKRIYRPYSITLQKFSHDRFVGTDMARNFASRIRLVDPQRHVDREIEIRMNEPLRYHGETFYQSGFRPGDHTTILQVVRNPAWLVPYFACAIGALGMLIHFGMTLGNFLRKRMKAGDLFPSSAATPPPLPSSKGKGSKKPRPKSDAGAYTLQPSRGLWSASGLVPVLALLLGVGGIAICAMPRAYVSDNGLDLETFARIPVSQEGRVMPIDSLARGTLKIIHGRESMTDEKGQAVPAVQWLADTLGGNDRSLDYKVFRIDHPQIKGLLHLIPEGGPTNPDGSAKFKTSDKYFSWNDIFNIEGNGKRLQDQVDQTRAVNEKERDLYQHKIVDLYQNLRLFINLKSAPEVAEVAGLFADPAKASKLENDARTIAASGVQPDDLTPDQRQTIEQFERIRRQLGRLAEYISTPDGKGDDLYFVAPLHAGEKWQGLGQAVLGLRDGNALSPSAASWIAMLNDLRTDSMGQFNTDVAAYQHQLDVSAAPELLGKPSFEVFFNRFDPFLISIVLYVFVFLLACVSWLVWRRPLGRAAFVLALLALAVHTFGLVSRMYISGRPPVTNLYSSALFIGWMAVVICLFIELIFRNSLSLAAAGVMGFATLLVAGGLYFNDADTMKQLQAVLDTNFWLATHVVAVTIGYSATFLAGVVAIAFILGGLLTPALTSDVRKVFAWIMYGIICYALLFSFVGTILGGIWADQSWGRFWGWDPKENGAILIVLWNALILHARWGGLIKERGVATLAVFGMIITSWSWFGTNMMGVGLHSYGFMPRAAVALGLVDLGIFAVVICGMLPLVLWRSYAADPPLSLRKKLSA